MSNAWPSSASAWSAETNVISFTHTEKLRERKIGAEDMEEAIRNGVIIEDYPGDPRGPSCLILGRSGGRTLHAVCGRLEEEQILIITAYEPDPAEWESDWRTRRRPGSSSMPFLAIYCQTRPAKPELISYLLD